MSNKCANCLCEDNTVPEEYVLRETCLHNKVPSTANYMVVPEHPEYNVGYYAYAETTKSALVWLIERLSDEHGIRVMLFEIGDDDRWVHQGSAVNGKYSAY